MYTMHIETQAGVEPHKFHLGTDLRIARQFAIEALARKGVLSVAIRGDKNKLVEILDFRATQDDEA